MSGFILLWCLLFLLVSSSGLQAEPVSLGKITVAATRTETPLKEVPASVSVLTKSDLAQKHLLTIDEALKNEAGVYLRRRKGLMDSLAAVTLRASAKQSPGSIWSLRGAKRRSKLVANGEYRRSPRCLRAS